ncbi:hypothetical protein B0H16DRAFT_1473239 [Mycena metata]|uniref:Uncharacterized protein n=1 Tax=Mycena metata TaxID=1033252 RepID=A0AAD7MMC2_9AGAR|nr:hypothetical protein B0H16DRAFT_1473239 [Mycena metata]
MDMSSSCASTIEYTLEAQNKERAMCNPLKEESTVHQWKLHFRRSQLVLGHKCGQGRMVVSDHQMTLAGIPLERQPIRMLDSWRIVARKAELRVLKTTRPTSGRFRLNTSYFPRFNGGDIRAGTLELPENVCCPSEHDLLRLLKTAAHPSGRPQFSDGIFASKGINPGLHRGIVSQRQALQPLTLGPEIVIKGEQIPVTLVASYDMGLR